MKASIDARSGELMTIPLCLLVPSEWKNARRTGGENVDDLKASIEAQGLLQNLIVCPAKRRKGRTQRYEVVGGGRRLRALNALMGEGRVSRDEPILCRVKPDREAAEASLAENLHREPMHPADEFEAFWRLVQDGRSVEEVAQRFGTSPITVRRRLKLADVNPDLLVLYRQDGITLEQLMALALSDNQDEQLRAWNALPEWQRSPHAIRSLFVSDEVNASTDALAKFVGIEAYEAAGGSVRRDLFSEEGQGYMRDPMLLLQLANARLEAAAEPVRAEGWGWVEIVQRASSVEAFRFGRARKSERKPSRSEASRIKALNKRLAELEAQIEAASEQDDPDEEGERLQEQADEVQGQLQAMHDELSTFDADAKAAAGAIVCVGRNGALEILRGLVRPEERACAVGKGKSAGKAQGDEGKNAEPRAKPAHSAALMLELTAHRTLAARAVMLDRPDVALTALLHCLVQRLTRDTCGATSSAVRLIANAPDAGLLSRAGSTLAEARAAAVVDSARERWGERIPGDPDRLLPWLAGLADAERMELLALCVAVNLNDVHDDEKAGPLDPLCAMLGLDMADWWEAKEGTYFQRVTKDQISQAISEAVGSDAAARYKGVSKTELARVAERDLSGKRWVPAPLRARAAIAA